jgi:hypothetical protein
MPPASLQTVEGNPMPDSEQLALTAALPEPAAAKPNPTRNHQPKE